MLPVLLILVSMELFVRHLPNSYRQKEMWMQSHAEDLEILILGNSHGLFGLCPKVFPKKAYNLCNVSQIFEYDEYLLRRYISRCRNLTDVLLIVDNSNVFDVPLEQGESFRCTYYLLYMDYPKHSRWSRYGLELFHIQAFKEKLLRGGDQCDSLGWKDSYSVEKRDTADLSDDAAEKAVEHHRCKDWHVAEENLRTLMRIQDLCMENHVRLILVQAPVTPAYSSRISQDQLTFVSKCHKIGGVLSVDDSHNADFNLDDFYDADHLTDEGALKWSRMISDRLWKNDSSEMK